jgi:hypothetical protein
MHRAAKMYKQHFKKNSGSPLTVSVKSSFSQIKLGLNWGILMQNWARIAINKFDPKGLQTS